MTIRKSLYRVIRMNRLGYTLSGMSCLSLYLCDIHFFCDYISRYNQYLKVNEVSKKPTPKQKYKNHQ